MWIFLSAGLLYLLGVAVILYLKPEYMFTPDGQWKEFGIGQNPDRYSPFPFWLFCITWALVSYFLVVLLAPLVREGKASTPSETMPNLNSRKQRQINQAMLEEEYNLDEVVNGRDIQMPSGYYVLNRKASRIAGTPKYYYLGPEGQAL